MERHASLQPLERPRLALGQRRALLRLASEPDVDGRGAASQLLYRREVHGEGAARLAPFGLALLPDARVGVAVVLHGHDQRHEHPLERLWRVSWG